MRRVTLTASGLWRAKLCIGSAVLPRTSSTNQWTRRGTIIHAFLQNVNRLGGAESGREPALALIEDEALRKACALLNLDRLPVNPEAYAAEVALAYDVVTGRARELHRKGDRDYSMCTRTEVPGTLDVTAVIGKRERAYVADYKPGFQYVTEPELNMQFKSCALLAARTWGCPEAEVEMIRFREDGEPYTIGGQFDGFALSEIAEEVRELHADATRAAAADVDPPIRIGSQCEGCDSISVCPSTQLVRHRTSADGEIVGLAEELTPELALEAYEWLDGAEAKMKAAWKVLANYAKFHPLRLRDGRVFGPHEKHRDTLIGQKVWHRLAELVGPDEAWKATKIAATKEDLKDLCGRIVDLIADSGVEDKSESLRRLVDRVLSRPTKRKSKPKLAKSPLADALFEDLAENGAMKTTYFEAIEAYKPPKELKE